MGPEIIENLSLGAESANALIETGECVVEIYKKEEITAYKLGNKARLTVQTAAEIAEFSMEATEPSEIASENASENASETASEAISATENARETATVAIEVTDLALSGVAIFLNVFKLINALDTINNKSEFIARTNLIVSTIQNNNQKLIHELYNCIALMPQHQQKNLLQIIFKTNFLDLANEIDVYPKLSANLAQQKRGHALKFYKKFALDDTIINNNIAAFREEAKKTLSNNNISPMTSLSEIIIMLSLLDPHQDHTAIVKMADFLHKSLDVYHNEFGEGANQKICAAVVDLSYKFLLNLVVEVYTKRAIRIAHKKYHLAQAQVAAAVTGTVITIGLIINTAGAATPIALPLFWQLLPLGGTAISTLSTSCSIYNTILANGVHDIMQIVPQNVVDRLQNSNVTQELQNNIEAAFIILNKTVHKFYHEIHDEIRQLKYEKKHISGEVKNIIESQRRELTQLQQQVFAIMRSCDYQTIIRRYEPSHENLDYSITMLHCKARIYKLQRITHAVKLLANEAKEKMNTLDNQLHAARQLPSQIPVQKLQSQVLFKPLRSNKVAEDQVSNNNAADESQVSNNNTL